MGRGGDSGRGRGRTRAFYALSLAEAPTAALGRWQEGALPAHPELRPISVASLHLTLAFLGDRDSDEVELASAVLAAIEPRAVRLRLVEEPIWLPSRRPGVLAFAVRSDDVVSLRDELAARLVEERLLEPPRRPFHPHLTVARVRGGRSRSRDHPARAQWPQLPAEVSGPLDAVRVALYRSELRTQGSRYSSLAEVDLPPAGGG
jgi:2'-5' RNA ligase